MNLLNNLIMYNLGAIFLALWGLYLLVTKKNFKVSNINHFEKIIILNSFFLVAYFPITFFCINKVYRSPEDFRITASAHFIAIIFFFVSNQKIVRKFTCTSSMDNFFIVYISSKQGKSFWIRLINFIHRIVRFSINSPVLSSILFFAMQRPLENFVKLKVSPATQILITEHWAFIGLSSKELISVYLSILVAFVGATAVKYFALIDVEQIFVRNKRKCLKRGCSECLNFVNRAI